MIHRVFIVLCLLATAGATLAEDYEIKVQRPMTVGQQFHESGRITVHQTVYQLLDSKERPAGEQVTAIVYDLQWKVLETGKLGGASKIESVIKAFYQLGEGADTALLSEGTRIISRLEKGAEVHESDKGEIPPNARLALDSLVSLEVEGMVSEDEVIGAKERKKVGDTWAMNPPAMVQSLGALGMKVAKRDVKGEVKLAAVGERSGIECMEIQTNLTLARLTLAKIELPPGMKMIKTSVAVQSKTWLPTDGKSQAVASESQETLDQTFEVNKDRVRTKTVVNKAWSSKPVE